MSFSDLSLLLIPFIGNYFYKIFNNKYTEYCENYTNNNYPKAGIKYMGDMKESPRSRKRVRFNDKVEKIDINYWD